MSKFLGNQKNQYQRVPDAPKDVELTIKNYQQQQQQPQHHSFSDSGEGSTRELRHSDDESSSSGSKRSSFFTLATLASVVVSLFVIYSISATNKWTQEQLTASEPTDAMFDSKNRYIMRNYDLVRPMSNFLNGIGGIWGIPMWAFYVNRGQGITSFGKQNKDNAIAKFVTAEKAYLQTPFTGFRTFLRGKRGDESFNYMPFFPRSAEVEDDNHLQRNMIIGMNELEIEEINLDNDLQTNVLYFIAPEQSFPSLVRSITFTNLGDHDLELEVLDGLGQLVPNGLGNYNIDAMGRTMEAWMNVYNVGNTQSDETHITQPFFHISQDTADTPQVKIIKDGYFAVSYLETAEEVDADGKRKLLPFIVDPSVVFGTDTTLTNPSSFFKYPKDIDHLVSSSQGTTSRMPCAFAGTAVKIPAGKTVTITSIYGYAESLETFVGKYSSDLRDVNYSHGKRVAAEKVVDSIVSHVATKTASKVFDSYVKQDFLDNILRGGMPIQLGVGDVKKNFHVYSRIHGDIERDYNYFQIDTTYFSQGPGNFRDVCQNRRLDVFFSPKVGDFNLRMFLSFIQADGFNPLTIASTVFKIQYETIEGLVATLSVDEPLGNGASTNLVKDVLRRTFRPGQFFREVEASGVTFGISKEEVMAKLISGAAQEFAGQFSQNGYWADHWTYILDIMDSFLSIFPDKEEFTLWDSEPVPFFMSPAVVKSRADRYTVVPNPANPSTKMVRVYKPITTWGEPEFSKERENAMNVIFTDPNYLVDPNGAASVWQRSKDTTIYKVSSIAKFLMLGMLKFSTLDPMGMGVEMEGGKPGWNDAMNGLPGILGSGMSETYEMLRILRYCKHALTKYGRSVKVPSEFATFITGIEAAIDAFGTSSKDATADFQYWDASNNAREAYRASTISTFVGTSEEFDAKRLIQILEKMEDKVMTGISKALSYSPSGLTPTYFYFDMVDYSLNTVEGKTDPVVVPHKFEVKTLPLFLEGPTRYMKVVNDQSARGALYQMVKKSPMYDETLKMYRLSESLASMGQDVGRMKAFSPGWLENQSIWLHMSYKFYLELLRGGLYEEFFNEILTGLVPFMDNKVYGRSPLEAASFIVSSAFPDKKLHGASFLARLSGSTAEFLSMWALMMAGPTPFKLNSKGALELQLSPILPSWLFNDEGQVSFTFLGNVVVTYNNPEKLDTWKTVAKSAKVVLTNGEVVSSNDAILTAELAQKVRNSQVKSIDIFY